MTAAGGHEDEGATTVAAVAAEGWRVVHLLRKAPWIRAEPIAAFQTDGRDSALPLVLDPRDRTRVVKVDGNNYRIAAPGESAAQFVDDAIEAARQHRAWLRATRDQRREEKRVEQGAWEYRRRCEEFERGGRVLSQNHPAKAIFNSTWLVFGEEAMTKAATRIGLGWFLAEHCVFRPSAEIALSVLRQRLDELLRAYDLPRFDAASLSRSMRIEGLEPIRYRGKIDGWKGIELIDTPPDEALPADEPAWKTNGVASTVFAWHCLRREDGARDINQATMLAAYRAWCIRFRIRPVDPKELSQLLRTNVSMTRTGPHADRVYQGVRVRMPEPNQLAFDRRARRAQEE